jgi:glycine/D-amino acid oxidase-like deaminating enzyme
MIKADVVIHAAGVAENQLDPFFGDKLYPVRFQMQRVRPTTELLPPFSAQLSYLQGAPRPDGSFVLGGCRWATPHLEAGESDPLVLSDVVDEKLNAIRGGLLTERLGDAEVLERYAGIMTFSCDGLPIVGPIPGRVGHLACVGWNGRPWSHALRAAVAIRDGLMTGRSTGWPDLLTPQRFV